MKADVASVVVLTVTGEIDLDNQDELERSVLQSLTTGSVVLDCSGLDFLSISALHALDVCAAAAELTGHHFGLARPSPHVARLLAVAGLDHLEDCGLRT